MLLVPAILKLLSKQYQPSSFVERRFQRCGLGFKTDEQGRPMLLFMGARDDAGKIRGRRYARRLVLGNQGEVLKDHWDDKGPST